MDLSFPKIMRHKPITDVAFFVLSTHLDLGTTRAERTTDIVTFRDVKELETRAAFEDGTDTFVRRSTGCFPPEGAAARPGMVSAMAKAIPFSGVSHEARDSARIGLPSLAAVVVELVFHLDRSP